ncbi:prepilin peptidase CpaA [Erythrobacter sanguineus]|uniref:Prepilin peptidase CpaA n=2 Tax=Erythrobacter sanguineus TaxID=198312 RepID=A0A1M7SD93_9SPHN|nr:prepilin peptidase CpaA [Erythrobacter sanguineus]
MSRGNFGGTMLTTTIHYGLLIGLAIALVFAAFTDIRRRQIDNWLNGAIALGAPLFWWASGISLWPDVAIQLGVAFAAFVLLAGLFALKVMGGGDVKLLTVLALWIPPQIFLQLLVIMAIAGGVLTIAMGAWHFLRRQKERLAIPYGVAIAFGGLWVLAANYLPATALAAISQ